MPKTTIIPIEFDNARHFLSALRLSNSEWLDNSESQSPWIFRGCGDEEYDLLPKAFRAVSKKHPVYEAVSADPGIPIYVDEFLRIPERQRGPLRVDDDVIERLKTIGIQALFEQKVIDSFDHVLDDLGQTVWTASRQKAKEDDAVVKSALMRSVSLSDYVARRGFSVLDALAQHHGLPTRMLDWSFNPLTAAYFATHRLDAMSTPTKRIAVWAIRRQELAVHSEYFEFHVPRAHVGHLRAQEALFTCAAIPEFHYRTKGEWPKLECPALRKLTLPYSEADELRRLLFAERYSEAHLMPGLDSIANALTEHWERRRRSL